MDKSLQTLNERIAERIGKDLVDLIPEDQWKIMVDAEITKFKRDVLPKMIQELLSEIYLDKAKVTVDKLTEQTGWNHETQMDINENLTEFIGVSSGVIVAQMLSPAMQMVLSDLRSRLGYG